MAGKKADYHAVKVSYNGEYRTYHIYKDNEPYIVPAPGEKISRHQARKIVEALNGTLSYKPEVRPQPENVWTNMPTGDVSWSFTNG